MAERCRECVETIWPHWNKCEEGKCVVADTYDAAAQSDHPDPIRAALEATSALKEGDHGYSAHVSAHYAMDQSSIVSATHEGPASDWADERSAAGQLPLFDIDTETQALPDAEAYEDIGL